MPCLYGVAYVWAERLLNKDQDWQIGDGRRTRVWGDRWLPYPSTFQVSSPRHVDTPIFVVCEFITVDFRWNVDLLSSVLSNEEVNFVRFIPLSKRAMEDRIIWHCDNKGKFTVKSAYHVARNWILPPSLAASSSTTSCPFDGLWEKLWKTDIPPKVKMIA